MMEFQMIVIIVLINGIPISLILIEMVLAMRVKKKDQIMRLP